MRQAVIENPVINSAFEEPGKHYKFDDDGITDEIVAARRPGAYSVWPCPAPQHLVRVMPSGDEKCA